MNKRSTLLLLFFIFALVFFGYSQSGWSDFKEIYRGSDVTILLSIKVNKNSCDDGEVACSYKYKVKGRYRGNMNYLTWSVLYVDCNGDYKRRFFSDNSSNFVEEGVKMDPAEFKFTCRELVSDVELENVAFRNSPKRNVEAGGSPTSNPPVAVDGADELFQDLPVRLKIRGGLLGIGAKWRWYKNNTDSASVGEGESLDISPLGAGTYYVRAEGSPSKPALTTPFVSKTVRYNPGVLKPDGITGKTVGCQNSTVRLTVSGGALGEAGTWVWYRNSCEGGELLKKSSERFLDLTMKETVSVFLRAESTAGENSPCVSTTVTLVPRNDDPEAVSGSKELCENEPLKITVKGNLVKGSVWELIRNDCSSGSVLETSTNGEFLVSRPVVGENQYYIRANGECGPTKCLPFKSTVFGLARMPQSIFVRGTVIRNTPLIAYPLGGNAGTGSDWVWYFGKDMSSKSRIGVGETLTYKPKKPGYIYLNIENDKCGAKNNQLVSYFINPAKAHIRHPFYNTSTNHPKFLHFGVFVGFDVAGFADYGMTETKDSRVVVGTRLATASSGGYRIGIDFNPLYKKHYSLGFRAAFSGNIRAYNREANSLKYKSIVLDGIFTAGHKRIKLFTKFQSSNDGYSITRIETPANSVSFISRVEDREAFSTGYGIGVRIGGTSRMDGKAKQGRALDLYFLNRNTTFSSKSIFNPDLGYRHGFGFHYWVQSQVNVGLEMVSSSRSDTFFPKKLDLRTTEFRTVLAVQIDTFY